jgi:osmotically inducible protein OsmC
MTISKATAEWQGTFKAGKGAMKPAHGGAVEFSAATRFEGVTGSTPEELIGAALAGCFSMALTVGLERAGAQPKSVQTSADVKLEKQTEGFAITGIDLTTVAVVAGIDDAKFQEVAAATKKGCPVSKALAAVSNITLKATLQSA